MSNFPAAISIVFQHEGGYVDNPYDKGGPTNFGISQRSYSHFLKRPVSDEEMKNMTRVQAADLYIIMFWSPMDLDAIENEKVAVCLFDMAVLMGPKTAIALMQESIRSPQETIAQINADSDPIGLCRVFLQHCQVHFLDIVAKNNSQTIFLRGWISRTHDLQNYIES